jgi:7,8-dihydropterin-6-yl-methyl-4-(beta-D-ribofuranosyl)aminobenzene 5'-phosphate synthase
MYILLLLTVLCAAARAAAPLDILVLYDNTTTRADAPGDWGFAALVTHRGQRILFDSGTKPDLLLANMKVLGVDPAAIGHAVISHEHGDHINGIYKVQPFNKSMKTYFLAAFPDAAFRKAEEAGFHPARVSAPLTIAPGVFSTGPVEGKPVEQALAIETSKGLVVITGCSHPGVVKMVEAAKMQRGAKSIRFLLGGFHMLKMSEAEATDTANQLRALGVESISPTHCTGDLPIRVFQKLFGDRYVTAGVGKRFQFD